MVPLLGTNMYSVKTQLAIKEFHTTLSLVVISNNRWSWHVNRSFHFSVPIINNLNRIYCLKACQNCDPSVVKESNKVILLFLALQSSISGKLYIREPVCTDYSNTCDNLILKCLDKIETSVSIVKEQSMSFVLWFIG